MTETIIITSVIWLLYWGVIYMLGLLRYHSFPKKIHTPKFIAGVSWHILGGPEICHYILCGIGFITLVGGGDILSYTWSSSIGGQIMIQVWSFSSYILWYFLKIQLSLWSLIPFSRTSPNYFASRKKLQAQKQYWKENVTPPLPTARSKYHFSSHGIGGRVTSYIVIEYVINGLCMPSITRGY